MQQNITVLVELRRPCQSTLVSRLRAAWHAFTKPSNERLLMRMRATAEMKMWWNADLPDQALIVNGRYLYGWEWTPKISDKQ